MTPTEDPAVVAARLDKYDQKAATLVRQMQAEHEAFRREVSEACANARYYAGDGEFLNIPEVKRILERFIIIKPVDPLAALAALIETRLLGVDPDDQDLTLEDHDWQMIVHALRSNCDEGRNL